MFLISFIKIYIGNSHKNYQKYYCTCKKKNIKKAKPRNRSIMKEPQTLSDLLPFRDT